MDSATAGSLRTRVNAARVAEMNPNAIILRGSQRISHCQSGEGSRPLYPDCCTRASEMLLFRNGI